MKMKERAIILAHISVYAPITVTEKMGCCHWPNLCHMPTPVAWEGISYDWKLYENHLPPKGIDIAAGNRGGYSELTTTDVQCTKGN